MKKTLLALILLGTSAFACMGGNEISLSIGTNDLATFNKDTYELSTDSGIRLAFASICGRSQVPVDMTKTVYNVKSILGLAKTVPANYDICLSLTNGHEFKKFQITQQELNTRKRSGGCGGRVQPSN